MIIIRTFVLWSTLKYSFICVWNPNCPQWREYFITWCQGQKVILRACYHHHFDILHSLYKTGSAPLKHHTNARKINDFRAIHGIIGYRIKGGFRRCPSERMIPSRSRFPTVSMDWLNGRRKPWRSHGQRYLLMKSFQRSMKIDSAFYTRKRIPGQIRRSTLS